MLPYIDRIGRRPLLLTGAVTCMVIHFVIAGVMASRGHSVTNVNGNYNLTWSIKGSSGMTVIAFSYIFTGIYGFTWVWTTFKSSKFSVIVTRDNRHRSDGSMHPKFFHSSTVLRALVYLPRQIGSSTLHWLTLSHQHSTISSGKHTSFLEYFAVL
jgi:hypothetical protein